MPQLTDVRTTLRTAASSDVLVFPTDAGWDDARRAWNLAVDQRPAVVALPRTVDDVVDAVDYASTLGLKIAVQGTGHGAPGTSLDGTMLVNTSRMTGVEVDPKGRTARVAAGTIWADVVDAAVPHGLTALHGSAHDVGVVGYSLGGGIGWLARKYGLSSSSVLSAEVVTADGEVVRADPETNAELFWALRGGGGNFGVVVDFTFQLHPVGFLLGGALDYLLEDAPTVLSVWRDLMANAPDKLASFGQVYRDPVTGDGVVNASIAWIGDLEAGREAIRELTDGLSPVKNTVRPMYYTELQDLYARMPFGLRNYWSGRFLDALPDELLAHTTEQVTGLELAGGVLFEPLHGAPTRVASDATAFAGREAHWNATFLGVWTDPKEDERYIETARAYSKSLEPWRIGGGYLNYATEVSADGLETEFGAQRFERLRVVKRQYDAGNVFRFNHNISPD